MRRTLKVFVFVLSIVITNVGVALAEDGLETGYDYSNICGLIKELSVLLTVLKVLAFAGAAFVLAAWAWDWITKGGSGDINLLEDAKKRGIAMFVGFTLLMLVASIIQFLPGFAGCKNEFSNFGQENIFGSNTKNPIPGNTFRPYGTDTGRENFASDKDTSTTSFSSKDTKTVDSDKEPEIYVDTTFYDIFNNLSAPAPE